MHEEMSSSTIHNNPNRHYEKLVHVDITIPHLNEGEKRNGDMKMQHESTCNVAKSGEPFATFPSLVIEMIGRLEHLVDSTHEFGRSWCDEMHIKGGIIE